MKQALLFLVTLTLVSCSKSDSGLLPNKLMGTWQLIRYCKPDGVATCIPVTVPVDKGVFIRFDHTGTFNEFYVNTKPVDYGFLGCGRGSYQLEGDNVRIRAACMSSLNGQLIKLVLLTDTRLILSPFTTSDYSFIRK